MAKTSTKLGPVDLTLDLPSIEASGGQDSLKQDPKPQVCSNFQMSFLQLSQMDPQ